MTSRWCVGSFFELPLSGATVVDGEKAVLECRLATPRRRRGRVVRQQRRDRFRDRQRVAAVECAVQRRRFADCTLRRSGRPVRGGRPSHGRRGHVVHCPAAARRHAVKGDAAVDKSKDGRAANRRSGAQANGDGPPASDTIVRSLCHMPARTFSFRSAKAI